MWKCWPIFCNGIWLYDTQNTLSHCEGSQKCIFHALCISAILLSYQSSSKQKGRIGDFILVWDSFIVGRFVVFCWYRLLLGDLSGDLKLICCNAGKKIFLQIFKNWLTPRPNVTSPDTVRWSNSMRSGIEPNLKMPCLDPNRNLQSTSVTCQCCLTSWGTGPRSGSALFPASQVALMGTSSGEQQFVVLA